MSDERLTRRERQAQTRDRLIEVASVELIRLGYRGTSLERMAEAAGFSKGAVYSNFSSKEELVLAVVDRRFHHRLDGLRDELVGAPAVAAERVAIVARWWTSLMSEPGWGALIFDLVGHSADKPDIREQMHARLATVATYVTQMVTEESDALELALPLPPATVARALLALGSGLAFFSQLDPDTPADVLTEVVQTLFGAAVGP